MNIFADIHRFKYDYSLLAAMTAGYLVFAVEYKMNGQYLITGTIIYATLYVVWGIWHHARTRSLHPRIVLEYLLVAALAVALVSTLLV